MEQAAVITNFINQYLNIDSVSDYCPNGLQVQGKSTVERIVCGVTACQELLDRAVEKQADMVIVHHGYFWKGDAPVVTGLLKLRLATLLRHDINLLAYHLPLDVHAELGNNVLLGKRLGVTDAVCYDASGVANLLSVGRLPSTSSVQQLSQHVNQSLGREPLCISTANRPIKTIAWCTGAAQDLITDAVSYGVDAFISGEISERTVHAAREHGIHYISAGHHATERYGIKALSALLAEKFSVSTEFIDVPNPV